MQQHGSKYLPADPTPWGWGQKVKIQRFQKKVMLHINLRESRMQQHGGKYFAHRPPPSPYPRGWIQKVEIQLFQNMVMLHIKLKGIMKCSNKVANIFPADPLPLTLGDGIKIQLFKNMVMLHIQLQEITNAAT